VKSYKSYLANLFLLFVFAFGLSSYLLTGHTFASTPGILDTRSITMSSAVNNQNFVKYSVSFKTGQAGTTNVGGIVIDFCAEDPIPTDTCNSPASFDTNKASLTISNQVGISSFVINASSTAQTLMITNATPQGLAQGTTVSFDLGNGTNNGIHNPATTNTTFYARMFTFSTAAGATSYTHSTPGTYLDYGGIALSTAAQLSIQSKVQETLSFCIYTGASCGTNTTILLGDTTTDILSTIHTYTNISGHFTAATNGANGMDVYASGATLTSSQGPTIAAIGGTKTTSAQGTEQFGFCVFTSGGAVNPSAPYDGNNCSNLTTGQDVSGLTTPTNAQFAFDSAALSAVGGQKIASASGPSATTTGTLAFIANIAPTTKSGIYTTTMSFTAVGKF